MENKNPVNFKLVKRKSGAVIVYKELKSDKTDCLQIIWNGNYGLYKKERFLKSSIGYRPTTIWIIWISFAEFYQILEECNARTILHIGKWTKDSYLTIIDNPQLSD